MNEPLYKIDARLANLLDFDEYAVDQESGEIVSLEEVEALQMAREDKIEAWGCWLKNRAADLTAIKAEIDNLTKRKKVIESQIENSKGRLMVYLQGEKIKTPKVSISYRTSKAVEGIDLDLLPLEYKRVETVVSPDKNLIKKAIEGGAEIEGAWLVERTSMIIK